MVRSRPSAAGSDWLLALVAEITGETPPGSGDELRLAEDLHLDSLGRVQLAAAIEEKLGMPPESGLLEQVQTLGQLRRLVAPVQRGMHRAGLYEAARSCRHSRRSGSGFSTVRQAASETADRRWRLRCGIDAAAAAQDAAGFRSPRRRDAVHLSALAVVGARFDWPAPRSSNSIMRPLVRLLAKPRVFAPPDLARWREPVLIVANHVSTYDGPLVQYALPGRMRRRIAAAMSGEMLDDFRHFRNPERGPRDRGFYPFGPIAYFLLTALFNVFPLPRLRDFQRSFAHAGEALDRGYHVLVFPEGTRSAAGQLARFRPGIGLLVKQSDTAVLPVAIRGLGELKVRGRGWFRSGTIEVHVGQPIRFAPDATETAITERLHAEVEKLLND